MRVMKMKEEAMKKKNKIREGKMTEGRGRDDYNNEG